MSKINSGGLDQYGAEPFEQQPFGTAGVEGVKVQWRLADIVTFKSVQCHPGLTYIFKFLTFGHSGAQC